MRFLRFCVAVTLLVLVVPGQAHAVPSPWPAVSVCTEVSRLGGSVQQSSVRDNYTVHGYVRACPGADDPLARWGVARYETGGRGWVTRPHSYATSPFLYRRGWAVAGTWAVCVVNNVQPTEADPLLHTANRVACVGPDPTGGNPPPGPVLSTPLTALPVDDPRFEGALLNWESAQAHPACGSCV
ncbi:hypothetical protein AB0M02_18555 [Actinoplanes sp. NPDC051861]|uniref:hypothetical protein n=1 Tax=Actinoplanes sp. NPDC051861 TaxID=3155170 RepID=UPI003412AADF